MRPAAANSPWYPRLPAQEEGGAWRWGSYSGPGGRGSRHGRRGYYGGTSRPEPCRAVAIAACILGPCTAACPLPIAHTETLSAPLSGVLRRSDGTPLPGAVVAMSPEYRDSTCANATLRTTTDSAGTFQLPAFQKRYRVAWLIPNFDPAVPTYSLCAGADTIRTAYHGYGSDRKSTRLNSSHLVISYAVFCLKKKKIAIS